MTTLSENNQCEKALKLFSEQLQCVICFKLPKNAQICSFCSALYCNNCIWHWITRLQDSDSEDDIENYSCCPHCRKRLRATNLIRLHFFDNIEHLGPTLEQSFNTGSILNTATENQSERYATAQHWPFYTKELCAKKRTSKDIFSKDS